MQKKKIPLEIKTSRRKEYADQTRLAIISAARKLFSEKGYAATRVEDIANAARVAAITVYTVVGGKAGLLRILMDIWSTAPILETNLIQMQEMKSSRSILEIVARTSRSMREDYEDIIYVMLNAAPHDQAVAETLQTATKRYRDSLLPVAECLAKLGALRPGNTSEDAVDTLWFYFGYWGWYTLHQENNWSYEKAEQWLLKAASQMLLQDQEPERLSKPKQNVPREQRTAIAKTAG